MGGHVEALMSEACDGRLDAVQLERFDRHLTGCERCRERFSSVAAAVDAVRSLPAAAMPIPVRLPAGLSVTTVRRRRIRLALPVAGAAVAGLAAAIALATTRSAPSAPASQAGHPLAVRNGGSGPATAAPVSPSLPAGAIPAGWGNHVIASVPDGSGAELVLATPRGTYPPGATVPVYARLLQPAGPGAPPLTDASPPRLSTAAALPVLTLLGGPVGASLSSVPPAPAAAPALPGGIVAPRPDGLPLATLSLPSGASPGQTLTLLASLPGGPGDIAPLSVELRVSVG